MTIPGGAVAGGLGSCGSVRPASFAPALGMGVVGSAGALLELGAGGALVLTPVRWGMMGVACVGAAGYAGWRAYTHFAGRDDDAAAPPAPSGATSATGLSSGGATPEGPEGDGGEGPRRPSQQDRIRHTLQAKKLPTEGEVKYEPPRNWHPSEPLPRGDQNGFIDRLGREWTKGPSRTPGEHFEWDVQLRNGNHLNVSWNGRITH